MDAGTLPKRELVPLEITYSADGIVIQTEQDNVNTGLAYLDSFATNQKAEEENNLLIVGKGTTEIRFTYPYFMEGILLSIAGAVILACGAVWMLREPKDCSSQ